MAAPVATIMVPSLALISLVPLPLPFIGSTNVIAIAIVQVVGGRGEGEEEGRDRKREEEEEEVRGGKSWRVHILGWDEGGHQSQGAAWGL